MSGKCGDSGTSSRAEAARRRWCVHKTLIRITGSFFMALSTHAARRASLKTLITLRPHRLSGSASRQAEKKTSGGERVSKRSEKVTTGRRGTRGTWTLSTKRYIVAPRNFPHSISSISEPRERTWEILLLSLLYLLLQLYYSTGPR